MIWSMCLMDTPVFPSESRKARKSANWCGKRRLTAALRVDKGADLINSAKTLRSRGGATNKNNVKFCRLNKRKKERNQHKK